MALNGTAFRFIEAVSIPAGTPGGILRATFAAQPTGSYPALGEPLDVLLAALPQLKVPVGVKPSNATIQDNLGHHWTFDPTQGTVGTVRNWTTVGATPSEHATAGYGGNEASAELRITLDFPLMGDMTR